MVSVECEGREKQQPYIKEKGPEVIRGLVWIKKFFQEGSL